MPPYNSQITEEASFVSVNLEYDFMMANLVRLNLAILKKSETFQEYTYDGVLC